MLLLLRVSLRKTDKSPTQDGVVTDRDVAITAGEFVASYDFFKFPAADLKSSYPFYTWNGKPETKTIDNNDSDNAVIGSGIGHAHRGPGEGDEQ